MIKNPHWDFENARMRRLAFFFCGEIEGCRGKLKFGIKEFEGLKRIQRIKKNSKNSLKFA